MPAHCNFHKLPDKTIEAMMRDYAIGLPVDEICTKHGLKKLVFAEMTPQAEFNKSQGRPGGKDWYGYCYPHYCRRALTILARRCGVYRMRSLKRMEDKRFMKISDKVTKWAGKKLQSIY